jgi:hypothetical protein
VPFLRHLPLCLGKDHCGMVTKNNEDARVPPYHKMLWPTLQAIRDLGNSGSNQEIEDKAIELERSN